MSGAVRSRAGLTLIELLVVIAIMAILAGLLLSGVQAAREASRRMQCASNFHQFGVAMQTFASARKMLPPGASENGLSLHVSLLPQMEATALYDRFDLRVYPSDPRNYDISKTIVSGFVCPSDGGWDASPVLATNYVGNSGSGVQTYGYNGVFRHMQNGGPILPRDVQDGLSTTAAMSEVRVGDGSMDRLRTIWTATRNDGESELDRFAESCRTHRGGLGDAWSLGRFWIHGDLSSTLYNHILAPNQNSCTNGTRVQQGAYTAGSFHPGGVNVLFADGHVSFVSSSVDQAVWRSLGSRNGREPVSDSFL